MKKTNSFTNTGASYETPKCEVFRIKLENNILSGGAFGDPGMPGSDLDDLSPLIF